MLRLCQRNPPAKRHDCFQSFCFVCVLFVSEFVGTAVGFREFEDEYGIEGSVE